MILPLLMTMMMVVACFGVMGKCFSVLKLKPLLVAAAALVVLVTERKTNCSPSRQALNSDRIRSYTCVCVYV
uniref:Putative secreted protein n=1 Tax=Anopheles triannulatus TaxID=58253 RepID=A0A2M4B7X3_9DIPT